MQIPSYNNFRECCYFFFFNNNDYFNIKRAKIFRKNNFCSYIINLCLYIFNNHLESFDYFSPYLKDLLLVLEYNYYLPKSSNKQFNLSKQSPDAIYSIIKCSKKTNLLLLHLFKIYI